MSSWNGEGIKKLWSTIWHRLDPYLRKEINSNKIGCMKKKQKGQIGCKTCYNIMKKKEII